MPQLGPGTAKKKKKIKKRISLTKDVQGVYENSEV